MVDYRSCPRFSFAFAFALLLFSAAAGAAAQEIPGVRLPSTPGIQLTTRALMERQAAAPPRGPRPEHELHYPDKADHASSPDAPAVSSWPSAGHTSSDATGPRLTPRSLIHTTGLAFNGATLGDTGAFPPDSMGAVGPSQFIVAVNGRIRTFNKTTGTADGMMDANPDVFFNSVMTPPVVNNFTSDPRIRYDRLSRRWFIIIIDVPGAAGALPNRVLLAVSDGPVLTGSTVWSFYFFQHDQVSPAGDTGQFADYPTLGIDANALYIGINLFGTRGSGSFANTTGFVVRKSSVLNGGPIVVSAFRGLVKKVQGVSTGPYTPHGVDNFDPNATEGYF